MGAFHAPLQLPEKMTPLIVSLALMIIRKSEDGGRLFACGGIGAILQRPLADHATLCMSQDRLPEDPAEHPARAPDLLKEFMAQIQELTCEVLEVRELHARLRERRRK